MLPYLAAITFLFRLVQRESKLTTWIMRLVASPQCLLIRRMRLRVSGQTDRQLLQDGSADPSEQTHVD